jgi:hypothetical protein
MSDFVRQSIANASLDVDSVFKTPDSRQKHHEHTISIELRVHH